MSDKKKLLTAVNKEFHIQSNMLFTTIYVSDSDGFPSGKLLQQAFNLLHQIRPTEKIKEIHIKRHAQNVKFKKVTLNALDHLVIEIE